MQQLLKSTSKYRVPAAPAFRRTSEKRTLSSRLLDRKRVSKTTIESKYDQTQLLSGWKEIANYMHQGVRTVQRWELIGLPVRRVRAKKPSPVIAFPEDLDSWAGCLHVPLLDRIEELKATILSLEAQVRFLKRQLQLRNRAAHVDMTSDTQDFALPQNCAS